MMENQDREALDSHSIRIGESPLPGNTETLATEASPLSSQRTLRPIYRLEVSPIEPALRDEQNNLSPSVSGPNANGPRQADDAWWRVNDLNPQDYARAIAAHAKQGTGKSLYPGPNFENLAQYLQQVYQQRRFSQRPPPSRTSLADNQAYASLYTLTASSPDRLTHFDDVNVFQNYLQKNEQCAVDGKTETSLLFLRGHQPPEWIATVGSWYGVDPEFWQRHLDFRSMVRNADYFHLPSLPSTSGNIISLRLPTIGFWETTGRHLNQVELDGLRVDGERAMIDYDHHLRMRSYLRRGASIVRQFSIHDENTFSIEQEISICVNKTNRGWAVLVWLDIGNDLGEGPNGPWLELGNRRNDMTSRLCPTIQHQPRIALISHKAAARPEDTGGNPSHSAQSSSLLHLDYGRRLDKSVMACDPFYAVNEIFTFVAFAETQFLNMIAAKLILETGPAVLTRDDATLSNLLHSKEVLENHAQRICANITTIKNKGSRKWPKAPEGDLLEKADIAAKQLLQDFEFLLTRAEELSAQCDRGMNIVMNNAMIAESKRAIVQAQGVAKLTRLAFFYIPLSFTTSFFGMNFIQFGTGELSIWLWFVVSFPIFLVSVVLLSFDVSKLLRWVSGWRWPVGWRRGMGF